MPPIDFQALPPQHVWALPQADTRAPLSNVLLRWQDGSPAIDGSIGADFPILELDIPTTTIAPIQLQAGVLAASFMGFSAGGELTFDLITFDGLFAFPLDIKWGDWSARLQWAHLSAHWGDGVRKLGALPTQVLTWSREFVVFQLRRDLGPVHPYIGLRYVTHSPNMPPPLALQAGTEAVAPWKIAPCGALDLQMAAEYDWQPAWVLQAGGCFQGENERFRLEAVVKRGPDDTGKMDGLEEDYIGLTFGFDRTGRLGFADH